MGFLKYLKSFKVKNKLFAIIFDESSIHGMTQVLQDKRHILERFFWLAVIFLSAFTAYEVCIDQYQRYERNPTVLSIETNYRNWIYKHCAITLCSGYQDFDMIDSIIENNWGSGLSNESIEYYTDFIKVVATTNYSNFDRFKPFVDDKTLENVNMLSIARELKSSLVPPYPYFGLVITEMGVCHSSTKLLQYQSVYSIDKGSPNKREQPVENIEKCKSIDVCKVSYVVYRTDLTVNKIYVHNDDDIMVGDQIFDVLHDIVIGITYAINDIIASEEVFRLSPERRKCLIQSESRSKYFSVYSKNLCKVTCRIEAAIKACKCIPFLYNVESTYPVCDPKGMYCLSTKQWYHVVNCECPEHCATEDYIRVHTDYLNDLRYSRMFIITMALPKTRIKRDVVFSFDDLLVSYGGAAALFLGCSFLSGVEIIYFIIEYLLEIILRKL